MNLTLRHLMSHKTLIMLLGYDPEENVQAALPMTLPHVTYAYTKHLWAMDRKNRAFNLLERFLSDYSQCPLEGGISSEERKRLLARCYLKLGTLQEHLKSICIQKVMY